MDGKYTLIYEDSRFGDKIELSKDFSTIDSEGEKLDRVLQLMTRFLKAITYNTEGLVNCLSEEEIDIAEDFLEKYRKINRLTENE